MSRKNKLTVVTWLWNQPGFRTKYTPDTVTTMRDMVKKYYRKPHRFVCVTDQKISGVETIPLGGTFTELENPTWKNGPSCYRRLVAFRSDIASKFGPRFVSIDLDAVIMGDLSPLWDRDEDIVLTAGISKQVKYCGTMWLMNSGCRPNVWDTFDPEKSPGITTAAGLNGSDQAWLGYCLDNEPTWERDNQIMDFSDYTRRGKLTREKPDCAIMFFNGSLKPWDWKVRDNNPWIKDFYPYEQPPRYRICVVQFENHRNIEYAKLHEVFKKSIKKNMPDAKIDEIILPAMEKDIRKNWIYTSNTIKLRAWVKYLETVNEPVIFADCDMLALGDAERAFLDNPDFDIAITGNLNGKNIPINGGIVFVRPNDRSRAFFRAWADSNELLYNNEKLHQKYRTRWAGMNQAAFGYLMSHKPPKCKLITLPLQKWNATDPYWGQIDDETVFVHIKSELRKLVLGLQHPAGVYEKAMVAWYKAACLDIKQPEVKPRPPRIPNRYL